ncbi:uncharacterized protein LOC109818135 [Cajanus cajan]|uniref:uncharacterized protein LOC109818135 n=1 Tax=Cajanus cajan TaxID=3821 RepID=UPI00098DCA25|nr:uncharacterized protein LOC109818135 [Cajanus cajan]
MSMSRDNWVTKAMADDTIVAEELLRFRYQRPSVLRRWGGHQRRTQRILVGVGRPSRASPTTPLTWTSATSVDGYEGSTRATAPPPLNASQSKAADQSEIVVAKKTKKRHLTELQRDEKMKQIERNNLKDELAAMNLSFERERDSSKSIKKLKIRLMARETSNSEQAVLDPPQPVEAHCDPSNLASAQTVQDRIPENESLICAASTSTSADAAEGASASASADAGAGSSADAGASASAPSSQEEIKGQKPFLLPDLNLLPDEYNTDFLGSSS